MSDRQMKEALVREAPVLRRFARSLVGDPALADDLVQDTFERALTRLHLYDARRALRPWLFRILRNLRISRFRQAARNGPHLELVEGETPAPSGSGSPDQGLALRDISRALDMLPDEQREVLVLVALEGMKYHQVTEILDIPIGTVMSRLSRARKRLSEILDLSGRGRIRRVK